MADTLALHYPDHLVHVTAAFDRALARAGCDSALIYSGRSRTAFLDDRSYPFMANPLFAWWLPLNTHPRCAIHYAPGQRPVLAYHQPADYWHEAPDAPAGFWVEHFDVRPYQDPGALAATLPPQTKRRAYLGEWAPENASLGFAVDNPDSLVASLHEDRTTKTDYELGCMRRASALAARGHGAAEQAFRAGRSEYGIHLAYLEATGHTDHQLPYDNIVALNDHGATLHYTGRRRQAPDVARSFLIDAGAGCNGYAADVTRTYPADSNDEFARLVQLMDQEQRRLCERAVAGTDFVDLHVEAHHGVARTLAELSLVRLSPEAIVESGISSTFLPHGLGHFIGLQVHDVAGHQVDAGGARREPPAAHPFLRLTRRLAPGNVTTIEPGLYFIGLLLDKLRGSPDGRHVDWDRVDGLRAYGGIRIEDDIVVQPSGPPENLTRDAFRAHATAG